MNHSMIHVFPFSPFFSIRNILISFLVSVDIKHHVCFNLSCVIFFVDNIVHYSVKLEQVGMFCDCCS